MNEHDRRIYDLCADLGDLQVAERQIAARAREVAQAIEGKHAEIGAAMRIRDRAKADAVAAAAKAAAEAAPPDAKVMT